MTAPVLFRLAWPIAAVLSLSACALGGSQPALTILAPQVELPSAPSARSPVEWTVQIQRPVADQMRDSDRVLVRRKGSRLQVYPGVAWLDSVPELLQAAMVQTFADSGAFAGVGRAGGLRTRFGLSTEIRRFELVDEGGGLTAVIVVQATLVEQRTARPMAQRVFRQEVQTASADIDDLVQAFEQGLSELLQGQVSWVLEEAAAPP
ncbi:MAG: ABC-type transport auxiliary lipoprotein family protein [Wenzhouxiangella sp.]|jgi:cholesterol transport system auxiliary component|nr:ABC-type transport auxiliary lipoprotein family protein [Wenzhouxiangella sp.]